jgi:hypothetical protein
MRALQRPGMHLPCALPDLVIIGEDAWSRSGGLVRSVIAIKLLQQYVPSYMECSM